MSYQSTTLRQIQLALFEEDFDLAEWERVFADEWLVNGNKPQAAMLVARPSLKPDSARVMGIRALKKPEVERYLDWKRAQLVMRSGLTEGELVEKARRVFLHGVGDLPLRKSNVVRLDDGTALVEDLEVRDPSLPAANAALELLRKIGGFGVERTETRFSGVVGVANLSAEQREARVQELASKAGLAVVPGLPALPTRRAGADSEDAG